jgi:hypothetical protein
MRHGKTRRLAALPAAALLALGILGLPAAAQVDAADDGERVTASDVTPTDEAWFFRFRQPVPEPPEDFDDPTGGYVGIARAEVRNRTNPFPANTLHVGTILGEPVARTFLGLSTFEVTDDPATIVGGTLRLTDNEEDSVNAERAEMIACLATDLVVPAEAGDWDNQYGFDCSTSSPAELVEGSDPLVWEIDLDPFAEAFADELAPGLAIVEAGAAEDSSMPDPTATWWVSFDTSMREEAALEPDNTAIVGELERIARGAGDIDTLTGLLTDPESIPTFVVLQVLPDVNALYAQSRVARQTDPDRDLRPASADLELVVTSFDFDFGDGEGDGEEAFPTFDDGGTATAGESEPFTPAPSTSGTSGSASFGSGGTTSGASGGFTPSASDEVAVADDPATADGEAAEEAVSAPAEAPAAAGEAELLADDGAAGGDAPLWLLVPLALGLAGALGWSLSSPVELAADRRGGALDRLMDRKAGA